MVDVDGLLYGAIAATVLFLVALGLVAAFRRFLRPRSSPVRADRRVGQG